MTERETSAEHNPDVSLEPTASLAQPDTSSARDVGDASGSATSDREKLFAIVRGIIKWQGQAASCLRDPAKLFAGRFRVVAELGQGGFGRVYRVVDQAEGSNTLGQELALKLLFIKTDDASQGVIPQSEIEAKWYDQKWLTIKNWIDEIKRHQNVQASVNAGCVPVLDAAIPSTQDLDAVLEHVGREPIWFAMPVYRQTLAQFVAERNNHGGLPVHHARRIMLSVAAAIQRLHDFRPWADRDKEIVHRDLKPANILMDEEGNPFVADFGLATGRFDQALTGNPVSGTPSYMAPEQYNGGDASQRTDIWAWGVIFYWLLAGRLPFQGSTLTKLRQRIISDLPPDDLSNMRGVPNHLAKIVMRCLSQKLVGDDGRYGSFREVIRAIRDGEFVPHRPPLREVRESDAAATDRPVTIDDLKFQRRWLEFVPNPAAEQQLRAFCDDPSPFLWWGVVGAGGVGKSRLAHELVLQLARDDLWEAGFLRVDNDDVTNNWLAIESRNWRPRKPTLIVIDYTARHPRSMLSFLLNLSVESWHNAIGESARVRVLLLDRPGGDVAPVSFEKLTDTRAYAENRDAVRRYLYGATASSGGSLDGGNSHGRQEPMVRDAELLELGGMARLGWRNVLMTSMAQTSLADALPALPPDNDHGWWDRVDRLTDGGRPLFLQILGICFVRRPESAAALTAGNQELESLLDDMLRYEREHHWVELFDNPSVQTTDHEFRAVERAVGFITLAGGITWPGDEDALHACAGGSRETIERVVPLILKSRAELDTGEDMIPPLQPDLLGERLLVNLARRIVDQPRRIGARRPSNPVDTDFWIRHALRANESGTIETIRLLAQDFPHAVETIQWTESLLRALNGRFSTTDEDDNEDLKQTIDLSWRASQVMRALAEARDRLDEPTLRLFLSLFCANRWAWLAALGPIFSDYSLESTATVLNRLEPLRRALAVQCPEHDDIDIDIQLNFAKGAVNAISYCADAQQFPQLEAWGDVLKRQAERHPHHDNIQLELARGAVNPISAYGRAQQFPQLEAWGDVLKRQAEQHPEHDNIQLELANGAFNAICGYQDAQQFPQLEAWGDVLKRQAEQHPDHDDIQLRLAKGAFNAICGYQDAQQFPQQEAWRDVLKRQAEQHPDHDDIQLALAEVAFNAICHYGGAQQFPQLKAWGDVLKRQAEQHPDHDDIQLELAAGAVLVLILDVELSRDEREEWISHLDAGLSRSNSDSKRFGSFIQFSLAFATDEALLATDEQRQRSAREVLVHLAAYWPEFTVGDGTDARTLGELMAELLAE